MFMWCNVEKLYNNAIGRVQESVLKNEDKTAIFQLVNKLVATKIKQRRAVKYLDDLRLMIERGWLLTYHNLTEADIYQCLAQIEQHPDYDTYTKRDYKIAVKRMLEHLNNPLASLIKTSAVPKYLPRFFLTVHDILKIISCDWPHLRDKAIASCLYESDCRPHEFFMLKRTDVRFENTPAKMWDGNGKMIKINLELAYLNISQECKTGARSPPLIFSVPWLKAWLSNSVLPGTNDPAHPEDRKKTNHNFSVLPVRSGKANQEDRNEYLWTDIRGSEKGKQMTYEAARKAIRQLAASAQIENAGKVTLYSFRHGRNTEVSQMMTYAQHCEFAGWHQGSDMPRVYNHLSGTSMISPIS